MSSVLLEEACARAREGSVAALTDLGGTANEASLNRFLDDYVAVGPLDHYRHVPAAAAAAIEAMRQKRGDEAAGAFVRAAMGHAIVRLAESDALRKLPERIQGHHIKQLMRIASCVAANSEDWTLTNDLVIKDMGLSTLRLLAAAAQVLDLRCGIPRSIIARQGVGAMPRVLRDLAELGGFKPYIQIHTHRADLEQFNPEGWNECYRCCTDLYSVRPDLLGMFGSSWFYDPALMTISSRLTYLLDVPLTGGCTHFFVETGGDSIDNATATSPSRRKLYEEGKYMPTEYMIAWGRKAQTDWALRHPA